MCLGIPGRVVDRFEEHGVLMGKVDFGGVQRTVCLDCVPEIEIGDYALIHVGFAISRIDEEEAQQVFRFLDTISELDEVMPQQQKKP